MNTRRTKRKAAPKGIRPASVRQSVVARIVSWVVSTRDATAADLTAKNLTLSGPSGPKVIPIEEIDRPEVIYGRLWWGITVRGAFGRETVPRLDFVEATLFFGVLRQVLEWRRFLDAHDEALRSVHRRLKQLDEPGRYVRTGFFAELLRDAETINRESQSQWPALMSQLPQIRALARIRVLLKERHALREAANERYLDAEHAESRAFFDTVEKNPLTDEQRRAVAADDDRNLVVAAAGSGKTSLIVAKIGWLLEKGYRKDFELLVLAYSKEAQQELNGRIRKQLGPERAARITVCTFHSLGRFFIETVEKKSPRLLEAAKGHGRLSTLLEGILDELVQEDPVFARRFRRWIRSHFAPYRPMHAFKNRGKYWAYLERYGMRSLEGDLFRSFEECEIANFLLLNGVEYTCEPAVSEAKPTRNTVKSGPFRLSGTNVEIRFFPLTPEGKPPTFFSERDKERLDERWNDIVAGVDTIDLFSHDRNFDRLIQKLNSGLRARGVELNPIPDADLVAVLRERDALRRFAGLLATFLNHCNGSGLSEEVVRKLAPRSEDQKRTVLFLDVFEPVRNRYQQRLDDAGTIDFNDMVNKATDYVKEYNGRDESGYRSPFTYILVDEFQDISLARAHLLQALLKQQPTAQLFAVGDDWQAILRFTGSDVGVFWNFDAHFGDYTLHKLQTSFRCPETINDIATRFIGQNEAQSKKDVHSHRRGRGAGVHICLPELVPPWQDDGSRCGGAPRDLPDDAYRSPLRSALGRIDEDAARYDSYPGRKPEVFLLGRYKFMRPDTLADLEKDYPNLELRFMTMHASKGREAEYAVLLGMSAGRYGFPSQLTDDPLLDMVLAKPEKCAHAEERRLLYVAMTRAMRRCFLLPGAGALSSFLVELMSGDYGVAVTGEAPLGDVSCARCEEGRLQEKGGRGDGDVFYGCTNYPFCRHTQPACPKCPAWDKGLPVKTADGAIRCHKCDAQHEPCPNCGGGWLLEKRNRRGKPYIGCANSPVCGYSKSIRRP